MHNLVVLGSYRDAACCNSLARCDLSLGENINKIGTNKKARDNALSHGISEVIEMKKIALGEGEQEHRPDPTHTTIEQPSWRRSTLSQGYSRQTCL